MQLNTIPSGECHRALQVPEFFSVEDLRNCRQVSTLWNVTSEKKWKSTTAVKLGSADKMADFLHFVRENGAENYFTNYIICGNFPKDTSDPFWRLCGRYIISLELHKYTFRSTSNLRNVIYHWTPNLEKFVLRNPSVTRSAIVNEPSSYQEPAFGENWNLRAFTIQLDSWIGIYFMEFLCHFPGVKTLTLPGVYATEELFQSLLKIRRCHPQKLMLKELFAVEGILRSGRGRDPHVVKVLVDTGLQIEVLSLGMVTEADFSHLEKIIKANMVSLKKIRLDRLSQHIDVVRRPIPILCQLESLTEVVIHYELLTSYEFLKFTPNLVSSSIVGNRDDNVPVGLRMQLQSDENVQLRMFYRPHSDELQAVKLKHCKEFNCTIQLYGKRLDQFINWLPNVERLTMVLDNDTFRLVCERWRNLKSLEMGDGSSVDECGITGMNAEDVDLINIERRVPLCVRKPNLTYLKHLRHLQMNAMPERHNSLDYCGVTYGVKQLPNLCTFDAKGYIFRITEHLWNELSDRFHFNQTH